VYETPLAAAAKHGRDEVLALLLEEIANWHVDAKEKALGRGLIAATKARHYSTMELLLRHGARVRDTDNSGRSALFYATQKKDRKATLLLLQPGAVTSDTEELRFLDEAGSKEVEEAQKCTGGLGESSLAEK
jgi:ankyrin repeat protein